MGSPPTGNKDDDRSVRGTILDFFGNLDAYAPGDIDLPNLSLPNLSLPDIDVLRPIAELAAKVDLTPDTALAVDALGKLAGLSSQGAPVSVEAAKVVLENGGELLSGTAETLDGDLLGAIIEGLGSIDL